MMEQELAYLPKKTLSHLFLCILLFRFPTAVQMQPTYDAEQEIADSPKLSLENFVEDWILSLSRGNTVSLALFLCHQLEQLLGFTATNAAEYA